ncbi:MAG: hypothetical protein GF421_07010 [Candidatus Aminicenantes bacterium]|nr:hypothetical protein [Candidatus Aminicenantes bacterium]
MKVRGFTTRLFLFFCMVLICLFFTSAKKADNNSATAISESLLDRVELRNIGPANMGGRIDDFAVVQNDPNTIYVGTASGGLWKTTNNGITWQSIFDDQETSSIGDVTVSPSNPDIVWVGTGEPNNRQSSSWGNGVYKSNDGGKTWNHMGLEETHHIGRIVIHPRNPDVVYVAALGHLWGPNKERGLYKTEDGGKTWTNTLFINEDTGFSDVAIDPASPNILYAASYQRRRRGWGFSGGGPHSGLYKTTDSGETWKKLTKGLPSGDIGRIGIDIYHKDPQVVYAIIENKKGGVFRSEDKGFTWEKMSSTNPRPMYYSQIRIDPNNEQRIWVLGARMYYSEDGGKSFKTDLVSSPHGDHHALWINPENSNHIVLGSDGGIYFSYDRGHTWDFVNTIPLGQFYEIGFDMQDPYWVYGGLQDNGSWGGPNATRTRLGVTNADWIKIGGGDGFYTQVDPTDPTKIYAESQNGNLFRIDRVTGERRSLRPMPESDEDEEYRFNWNSPIHISPHNPNKIYYGGNRLFISTDRGETWEKTPDLTTQTNREKMPLMGEIPDEDTLSKHDGIAYFGDITTISESPLKQGLLYVGTDDGLVQVSHDSGETWEDVSSHIPNHTKFTYVTRVVASQHAEARAYATLDGHRNNDFRAQVFVTENFGKNWKDISNGIPEAHIVNVIREHHRNPDLLFIGTERGAYFSVDRGNKWIQIKSNFPTVPVDDIAIHPKENDLILGTHGRSIWILDDITFLEQMDQQTTQSPLFLFKINPAVYFNAFSNKGNLGDKLFVAPNPPMGAVINYYLKEEKDKKVTFEISDSEDKVVRSIKGPGQSGIHRITWDLKYDPPESSQGGRSYFRLATPFVLPGTYKVTMNTPNENQSEMIEVMGDPQIDATFEDRKAQHDALYQLYKLYEPYNQTNDTLTNLTRNIRSLKTDLKKVKDLPEVIDEKIESISKEIKQVRIELNGDPEKGWRGMLSSLRGKLYMLGSSISSSVSPPSESQLKEIKDNISQLKSLITRTNSMIEKDIPELNNLLIENKIPRLIIKESIKFDEPEIHS